MHRGAQGVISVISNAIPRLCFNASKIVKDKNEVQRVTDELGEICEQMFCESNPIPLKWALFKMEIFESPELRLPLVPLSEKFYGSMEAALKKCGVL